MKRTYRAGSLVEDYCRACKIDREHTVMAVNADDWPVRVVCGYCRSEHNFRGGPRVDVSTPASAARAEPATAASPRAPRRSSEGREPFPLVSDRERTQPPVTIPDATPDLELLLRRVIREESGLTPAIPADRWRGGTLVLRPATSGVQEKTWPIETFFHKIVMLRNRLRTLEQQVNGSALSEEDKVKLQGYITGCYGSLTSFNVLFADERDQFKGSGGD